MLWESWMEKKKLLKSFLHTCLHPAPVRLSRTADTFCSSSPHACSCVYWASPNRQLKSFVSVSGRCKEDRHHISWTCLPALHSVILCHFLQKRAVVNYTVGFYEVSQPIFSPIVTLRDCPRWASFLLCKNLISRSPKQQKLKEPFQFENWQKTVCTVYRKSVFWVFFFFFWGRGFPLLFDTPFCAAFVYAAFTCAKWKNGRNHLKQCSSRTF